MIRSSVSWILLAVLAMVVCGDPARAEVRLPHVLGSHMVLQRDMEAPLWGWAEPGEAVTVSLGEQRLAPVKAGSDGRWVVKLPPQAASPSGQAVAVKIEGTNTITLENVVFGDVWICSGQSNMDFRLFNSLTGRDDIAAADHPMIRLLKVPHQVAAQPQEDSNVKWTVCTPQTVPTFSAVGYYFGRDLHAALDVPIGLIHTAYGGTPVGAWMPSAAFEGNPAFAATLERGRAYADQYPETLKKHEASLARWEKAAAQAREQGKPEPRKPRAPNPPERHPALPSVLYNGMVHPLVPLGIKGAIWYQGENNAARAAEYRLLLPAMIQGWRRNWGQGDFPFGIVQLANYMAVDDQPRQSAWAELREAQAISAATVANCGLAVTIDVGEAKDIHPRNKHEVGRRLGLWALARVYGRDLAYSGPVFDRMTIQDGSIRLTFQHAAGGLKARDGGDLVGFAIAGEDRAFTWAQARIDGDSVLVSSPQVTQPVAVRYAWGNNPVCNLDNAAGLPAVPFRTDDWPGTKGSILGDE